MSHATTTDTLELASVDDYLGPAETRFFGAGYRRADYRVSPLALTVPPAGEPTVETTVAVTYPSDWSRKKQGVDLRPHLSTVDVLLFGAQLADVLLALRIGLSPAARGRARLRKAVVRAGTEPQEDLGAVPLSAAVRSSADDPGSDMIVTVVDCRVGVMKARCEIVHERPAAPPAPLVAGTVDLDAVLGDGRLRYWAEGYRSDRQSLTDVVARSETLEVSARLAVTHGEPSARTAGLGADHEPGVSLVDAFVSLLQLTQVALYELDHVDRSETNTLWMLQTTLEAPDTPVSEFDPSVAASITITGRQLLPVRGATWRHVDIAGHAGDVALRCVFAHELPPAAAAVAV